MIGSARSTDSEHGSLYHGVRPEPSLGKKPGQGRPAMFSQHAGTGAGRSVLVPYGLDDPQRAYGPYAFLV